MPDDDAGTVVDAAGVVKSVEDGKATIEVTVTNDGQKVLGRRAGRSSGSDASRAAAAR